MDSRRQEGNVLRSHLGSTNLGGNRDLFLSKDRLAGESNFLGDFREAVTNATVGMRVEDNV